MYFNEAESIMPADAVTDINSIIQYWFGDNEVDVVEGRDSFWFSGGSEVDQQIKDQFSALVINAKQQKMDDWERWINTAKGSLAVILLLDQFTRNIYRGNAEAFVSDNLARSICLNGLKLGFDQQLTSSERVFYYLPLEHSELIVDQERCVKLFKQLANNTDAKYDGQYHKMFSFYEEYAVIHYEIIKNYGRFPHRNALLGRESTAAELNYLSQGGHTFEQS